MAVGERPPGCCASRDGCGGCINPSLPSPPPPPPGAQRGHLPRDRQEGRVLRPPPRAARRLVRRVPVHRRAAPAVHGRLHVGDRRQRLRRDRQARQGRLVQPDDDPGPLLRVHGPRRGLPLDRQGVRSRGVLRARGATVFTILMGQPGQPERRQLLQYPVPVT